MSEARLDCPFPKLFPSQLLRDDVFYMSLAYNQAIDAWREDEVPVGAIIELGGEVIAAAHNQVDGTRDPTAHAEILAMTQAARAIGDWRLTGATLYVTKEPCPMCSGATLMATAQAGRIRGRRPQDGLPGRRHRSQRAAACEPPSGDHPRRDGSRMPRPFCRPISS